MPRGVLGAFRFKPKASQGTASLQHKQYNEGSEEREHGLVRLRYFRLVGL